MRNGKTPRPRTGREREAEITLQDIIPYLQGVRRVNGYYIACCPAHDDRHPSLTLREEGGRLLWHCHAGCSQERVLEAFRELLGHTHTHTRPRTQAQRPEPAEPEPDTESPDTETAGVTLAEYAHAKGLDAERLQAWGCTETQLKGKPCLQIPYRDDSGEVRAIRYRIGLNGARFLWRTGDKPLPFGLWRLNEWSEQGEVYLCEGETDTFTLWHAGLPAIGVPGASAWQPEWWRYLRGFRRVVVIPDNDTAGKEMVRKLFDTCPVEIDSRVEVLALPADVKDANELWQREGCNAEAFTETLNGSHFDTLTPINRVSNCQTAPEDPKCPPLEAVDLAEQQPAPMEWLIENLIPARHATNLYGDSGVCKTYLGLAIARACITGDPFAGYPIRKRGNVLYLDLELDTEEHTRRWWAICTGAGDPHPPKGLYYVRLQTDLFTAWVEILRLVNELQPVLVIVDSFGKAVGKPLDPDLAIKLYTYFDSLDCAVLVIDHSPKPTADMPLSELREYGTVYKRHYARSAFQLELIESMEGRVGVMMRHQKSNFGRTVPEIPLLFEFEVEDSTVLAVRLHTGASAMQQQSELFGERGAILEYLREQGEATVKMIADALNLEEHKVRRGIKGLEKAGLVERVPDSYPHRYRLAGSATGQFDTLTPINRVSNCQSGSPSAPSPDGLPSAPRAIEDPPAVLEGEALVQGILDTFGGRVLEPTESRHALLEWLDLSMRAGDTPLEDVNTARQCLLLAGKLGYPRLAFTYNGKIHTIEAGERAWLHALADMTGTPYCEQALLALRWFANDAQRGQCKRKRAARAEGTGNLFEV